MGAAVGASSSAQTAAAAAGRARQRRRPAAAAARGTGRRGALAGVALGAAALAQGSAQAKAPPPAYEATAETSPLIAELLERSKANKEKYDKERLDSYYRRNYEDYFALRKRGVRDDFGFDEQDEMIEELLQTWKEQEGKGKKPDGGGFGLPFGFGGDSS